MAPSSNPAVAIEDLVFVGLRGYALALHRGSGQIIWSQNHLKSGYTTVMLDGDRLIVSTGGYLFCLHPLTGAILWENPLTGYGTGVTSLASVRATAEPIEAMAAASDAAQRHAAQNSAAQ